MSIWNILKCRRNCSGDCHWGKLCIVEFDLGVKIKNSRGKELQFPPPSDIVNDEDLFYKHIGKETHISIKNAFKDTPNHKYFVIEQLYYDYYFPKSIKDIEAKKIHYIFSVYLYLMWNSYIRSRVRLRRNSDVRHDSRQNTRIIKITNREIQFMEEFLEEYHYNEAILKFKKETMCKVLKSKPILDYYLQTLNDTLNNTLFEIPTAVNNIIFEYCSDGDDLIIRLSEFESRIIEGLSISKRNYTLSLGMVYYSINQLYHILLPMSVDERKMLFTYIL